MPNIARKRRLEAFLSYIAGTGPRPEDSLDGSLVAGLTRADQLGVLREFGIDDPLGSFGVEQPRRRKKRDPNAKKSGWTDKGMQEKGRDAANEMNRARGKGPRTDRLYQAADLLRRVEELKIQPTGGAKGTKATIVDVATALQRRTLKEFLKGKPIPANDFSDATKERISDWMVDEVAYEYEPEQQAKSGAGWYTQKFQDALDTLAGVFPELKKPAPRAFFTAVVAVTSDGQTVQSNLRQAVDAWRAWKSGKGSLTAGEKGSYRGAIAKHLSELEELHHEYGDGLADWLLEEDTVGNLRRLAKEQGVDLSLSDYSADAVMPRAVLALGPKLGAFFANLMGRSGYLTMDRWWNRTFARYRGQILPTPTRSGLGRFKKLLGNEKMDDEEALLAAAMAHFTYKERDYKDGSEIEKAGNTITKAAFIELNDKPVGAKARDFMIATANDAVRKLGERGIDLTVADLQATLWYFEKRLYSTLGAEDSGEQSYADVVRQIAEEAGAQDAGRSKRAEPRGVRREARQGGPAQANVPERLFQEGIDPRDEGSPAGHVGTANEVLPEDRMFQGASPVSSHRLSDGRSIIFDKTRDETWVVLLDVSKAEKIADEMKNIEGATPAQQLAINESMKLGLLHLKDGDVTMAEEAFRSAMWSEGEVRDPGGEDSFGSKLEPILVALDTAVSLQDARTNPEGTFQLSAENAQVLSVAADEFEAATGRMQQDETSMAGARGYFERPPPGAEGVARAMRVFLNKRADVSTVMHESAHGFLEMLGNLAEAEDAGPRTKQQWADVLKWLGVEKRSDIKREHHEKFARGFEAFLLEGKAPKKGLRGVFSRFKTWLTRIYRTVANLDVKLDDNVRRIFERMLATEDEIQRALGRRGKPAFDSAEEAGLTPEEWAEKQADDAEARDWATRDALAAHTRVALAEKERDWKDFVESQRPAAEAEFDARQDAKAKAWLEGRPKDLLDTSVSPTPIVLDRKATQDAVGASAVKRFKTRAQGGVHPDEVAAVTGYATGREMLQAIASMPKRDAWVATRAEQLARESDAGNAQELDELRRQVRDGVQTYTEQRILREWAELGRRAEPGDDVSPLGRQVALMQLKRAAQLVVEATPVGRLQPGRVLAKERAAAKKVREAALKGDFDAAREWFRQQALQTLVHRATLDALEQRASFERLADELASTESRKRLGKASPVLRDAAEVLLERMGWDVETEADLDVLEDLPAVFEESGGAPGDWFDAVTESGVLDIGDATRLTVAQLRAVDDGLRQIRAEARLRNETMGAEQRADVEAIEAELLDEAASTLPLKKAPGTGTSDTALDTVLAKASALDGFLLNPADLVRDLTGDNIDSTWWRTVIEPLQAAKHREAELLKRAVLPVTEAIESLPASVRSRLREGVDGHALFPTHTKALQPPRQRHELLMLALNVGNEGNLQRLLDGRGITLDQVAKALDTLTDAELRWVEKVWDAVSELKKDAFDLEERQTGIRPRGVEAKPFPLPSGRVLKGGYFPAVYDRRGSMAGERQQEQQVASLLQPGYVRPGTSHGYVKRRAERVTDSAISLDLRNIQRHLAQVAHDVAFREPIQSVGRLILRPAVQQALRERLGDAKARSFRRWLQDVGGNTGTEVTEGDSLVSWARGAGAHVLLGWSTSTALGDFANLATALTGTPLKTKHLAAGLADFARAPVAARKAALEASPWLRTMVDNTRREFDRQLKTMLDRQLPKPLQWYKDNAFFFMEQVAVATTTPVWLGAHRQALQEGRTPEEAARFADDVLSQVFPSHHPVDQAAILRDRTFWGRATIFYGYLSTAYRQQHRIIAPLLEQEFLEAGAGGKALTAAKVAGGLLGFWTAFSVLGELLMGRGPEAGDDDEDDPSPLTRWRNWYLRKLVAGPLSTQPFLPLSTAWEAMQTGKIAPSPRSGPLASIVTMIGKDFFAALDGEKAPLERVTSAAKVAVQALGLPLKPFTAQGSFLLDVATGGEVGGPGGASSGLIYGRRPNQPANVFQPGLE